MKKAEIILGILALLAIALNLLLVPGSGIITVLSLMALSIFYAYFSVAFFNDLLLKVAFKKESYKEISTLRVVGAILTGFALAITIVGLLFKFQSWPGASINLLLGFSGLAIALIVGLPKYLKTKSKYYSKIFKRIGVYGGFALMFILLPSTLWLELKYRNHPYYVEAVKKVLADPGNESLQNELDRAWQRMKEER
jgi:uncharacterized membrane protein